jgi:hypothetical protein
MGTELPTKVMLGQTLVLMQMTFLNNVRKVGRLVLYTATIRPPFLGCRSIQHSDRCKPTTARFDVWSSNEDLTTGLHFSARG